MKNNNNKCCLLN